MNVGDDSPAKYFKQIFKRKTIEGKRNYEI